MPPGYKCGDKRPDPSAEEKPLFSITGQNMDEYADKLAEGVKALLKKYPSFRLDLYPTHRTAAAPQYVYDNTFENATRAMKIVIMEEVAGTQAIHPVNCKLVLEDNEERSSRRPTTSTGML